MEVVGGFQQYRFMLFCVLPCASTAALGIDKLSSRRSGRDRHGGIAVFATNHAENKFYDHPGNTSRASASLPRRRVLPRRRTGRLYTPPHVRHCRSTRPCREQERLFTVLRPQLHQSKRIGQDDAQGSSFQSALTSVTRAITVAWGNFRAQCDRLGQLKDSPSLDNPGSVKPILNSALYNL